MTLATLDTPSDEVADLMVNAGFASNGTNGDNCGVYVEITEWASQQIGGMNNATTRILLAALNDPAIQKPYVMFTSMALMVCVPELCEQIDNEMKLAITATVAQNSVAAGMLLAAFGSTLEPGLHYECVQNALHGIESSVAESFPGWNRHY